MTFSAKPQKRLGQHWLRSDVVLQHIVEAAELTERDCVLEIGPGTGALTQRLLSQAGQVVAVEIDRDLCQKLAGQFSQVSNFRLIQEDILQLNLEEHLAPFPDPRQPNKVVANIPYYITGPILEKLLGTLAHPHPTPFESIVLLVQQEIAARLTAAPGSRICGALSIRVQYLAECNIVCTVPPKAFHPPPKVSSAVVCLRPRPFPVPANDRAHLQQLITAGFSSKRKMLRNNLSGMIQRDRLLSLFETLQISENVRAEQLSVANWVALSNKMLEGELFS